MSEEKDLAKEYVIGTIKQVAWRTGSVMYFVGFIMGIIATITIPMLWEWLI